MPAPPPDIAFRPSARPLRIGALEFALPAVQAALSGYSDGAMRRAARRLGAPYCLHEVVLDRDVLAGGRLVRHLLDLEPDDHPIGGQLMGSDPSTFGRAARQLVDSGYDVIDLNFGCPVPKVLGRCRGGFMLSAPDTALEIVERVLESVAGDRPVTLKMRRGIDDSPASESAFFSILEGAFECGVAAITVHPRSVKQRYVGPADWSFLSRVRTRVPDRVLLGSGDLFDPWAVLRMLHDTGVDGVTVARGAIGNPWIFGQLADLRDGRVPAAPTIGEQRIAIASHLVDSLRIHGPRKGFSRARTHAIQYAATHPDHVPVRDAFVRSTNEQEFNGVLATHYPERRHEERSRALEVRDLGAQHVRDDAGSIACEEP